VKAVTANDLFSGATVWLTADGQWSMEFSDAAALEGEALDRALAAAEADETRVVGPYAMDVSEERAPSGRARLRETIRAAGPTIHPQYAKSGAGAL